MLGLLRPPCDCRTTSSIPSSVILATIPDTACRPTLALRPSLPSAIQNS